MSVVVIVIVGLDGSGVSIHKTAGYTTDHVIGTGKSISFGKDKLLSMQCFERVIAADGAYSVKSSGFQH